MTPKDVMLKDCCDIGLSHELCLIPVFALEPLIPINSHAQTPQTPDNPVIVYTDTQTQLWSSHLPTMHNLAFDPQGLIGSNCVMSICVKAPALAEVLLEIYYP